MVAHPRFPPELEHAIFEMFIDGNLKNIPTILTVSWRVFTWFEPKLYEVLTVLNQIPYPRVPAFDSPHGPPLLRVGPYVKHLIVGGQIKTYRICLLLNECTNVTDFAQFSDEMDFTRFLQILNKPGRTLLKRLTTRRPIQLHQYSSPGFIGLTHVDLIGDWARHTWKGLASLPQLTHLSFTLWTLINPQNDFLKGMANFALSRCSQLCVLVVFWSVAFRYFRTDADGHFGMALTIQDERLVLMEKERDPIKEWTDSATGKATFWDVAEEIIEARKNGDSTRYVIRSPGVQSRSVRLS